MSCGRLPPRPAAAAALPIMVSRRWRVAERAQLNVPLVCACFADVELITDFTAAGRSDDLNGM